MSQDINIRILESARDAFWDTIKVLNKGKARDDELTLKDYLGILSKLTPKQAAAIIQEIKSPRKRTPILEAKGV